MSKEVKLTVKDNCCGGGCCSGQETGVVEPQIITNNTSRYVIDATMHLQQPSKNDESYRYVV